MYVYIGFCLRSMALASDTRVCPDFLTSLDIVGKWVKFLCNLNIVDLSGPRIMFQLILVKLLE